MESHKSTTHHPFWTTKVKNTTKGNVKTGFQRQQKTATKSSNKGKLINRQKQVQIKKVKTGFKVHKDTTKAFPGKLL